jgi:hypothetical protein
MPTTETLDTTVATAIAEGSLADIATIIRRDLRAQGKAVPFGAAPYLDAMGTLNTISDHYGLDSARSIVAYLLGNLNTYRGAVARAVKAELKARLKG